MSDSSRPPESDARPTDYFVVIPTGVLSLGPYATAVYGVLRDFADMRSHECWPSHKSIAVKAGLSERKVQSVLRELRAHGWITWTQRKGGNGNLTSNVYRLYGSQARHDVHQVAHEVHQGGSAQDAPPGARDAEELIPNELVPSKELVSQVAEATIDDRPDITEVIRYLSQSLDELGVKHEPTKEWRNVIRLMIDRDGITPEQIVGAIRWAHADDFWRGNILSPRSLRKHFSQMRLHAQRPRSQQQTPVNQALQLAAQYAQMGI